MIGNSFYFIRHGETDWNRENRTMGQQDIPLNSTGKLQAQQAVILLKNCDIMTICHSPLKRAKETAFILNEILQCTLIEVDFLKECCWGAFEGELKDNTKYLQDWINGITPKGAETLDEFKERAINGIKLSLTHPNPLIVSHGGVYWVLQQILGRNSHYGSAQNCLPFHFFLQQANEWVGLSLKPLFDEEPFET